jgi:hypothetical protein
MFDHEQSIGEWRNKMLATGIKTLVMEELESHLREEFELQVLAGLEAPLAFDAAVRQIGQAPVIKMEFAKIERPSNLKTIRKILARLTALIVVFGVGLVGLFVWRAWPVLAHRPTQFTVAVTGQSGLPFTGVIKADGNVMSVSGIAPTNYVIMGRSVDCRFQKRQAGGVLGVCLRMKYLNGTCAVTTSKSGRGVGAFLSLHNGSCYTF